MIVSHKLSTLQALQAQVLWWRRRFVGLPSKFALLLGGVEVQGQQWQLSLIHI